MRIVNRNETIETKKTKHDIRITKILFTHTNSCSDITLIPQKFIDTQLINSYTRTRDNSYS